MPSYATVTDPGGRLDPDSKREDFQVDDNGKAQQLTVFANEVQPITVVMMLDRSVSMRRNFGLVEKAAEQFVESSDLAIEARIGSFSNRIQVDPRTFTSDHGELVEILRSELQDEGPTPLWNAVNVGITALLHEEGRRVVLVFTDGVDAPFNPGPNSSSLKDVMKRAEEENVMVYAIGLAGVKNRGAGGGRRGGGRRRLRRRPGWLTAAVAEASVVSEEAAAAGRVAMAAEQPTSRIPVSQRSRAKPAEDISS